MACWGRKYPTMTSWKIETGFVRLDVIQGLFPHSYGRARRNKRLVDFENSVPIRCALWITASFLHPLHLLYMIPTSANLDPEPHGDIGIHHLPSHSVSLFAMEPSHSGSMEQNLQSVWAHVLNLPDVALDQPFLSVGGDSISAMQVVGQCRKQGMGLGVQEVLRSRSITQLATCVKNVDTSSYDYQEYFDEEFDLTPIQYLYFQRPNTHGHFNQSFYLRVARRTSAVDFKSAVEQLVTRHPMLRARFSFSTEYGWQQCLTNDVTKSFRFRHATVTSQAEVDTLIEDSQQCFDHVNGPLFAADFFDWDGEQYAFLTGHHLVVDLVTWRLLLEELEEILKGGQLLPPGLPFQKWEELQVEHAKCLELDEVLPPVNIPRMDFSYWGIQHEDNTYGNAGHTSFELGTDISTAFLTSCHRAYKTEPVEILLASLLHSWSVAFKDRPIPAIFNEGHGREPWSSEVDITRTVGWFTALSPILVAPSGKVTDTVRKVKDFKRSIPGNGRPYFARRCLTEDGRNQFASHWPMEILFNYLGQYQQLERADALLQPLGTMAGETGKSGGTSDFGHDTCRWGLFEISAFVFKGHLKVAFTYNRHMQHQDLVQEWIRQCQSSITQMVQALTILDPKPTLSDFPLLALTEESFCSMIDQLSAMGVHESNLEDVYPCSSMQEGLLLSQTKDSGFYAAATLHEIKVPDGHLGWEEIARAWSKVVHRHPALRTVFLDSMGTKDSLYNQAVLKKIDPNVVHLQCKHEAEAVRLIEQQRSTSYANGLCPNHRFTICTTADERIFCSLDISHAIMDGHSMSLLMSELRQACQGELVGEATPYSDYISWSLEQPREASIEFWKSYLGGSEVCSFPVLDDGHAVYKELSSIRMDLSSIGLPDLQSFCNNNGITLSNVFHTAWALTLSLYVGSPDVTFGYLTSACDAEEVHGVNEIVGPIINTLVCRVNMTDSSRCLLDVLQNVQRDYMEAIPHQHIALADVQHQLKLAGANLFNTALSYRRLPQSEVIDDQSLHLLEVRPIYDPTEYPVSVNIEVGDETAAVDLDYWTNHLSAAQATNVASTFVRALENIVFNAKRRICALENISQHHVQQIHSWNIMPATINQTVHQKFASWVILQPDAPAICAHDGKFTYAELDDVTDRLAHLLVGLGVGPEIFVPTCFDKSCFAIVAMLAVLKAGGAAVPLDATHPRPALQTRLEDAGANVVLTTTDRAEKFTGLAANIITVNTALLDSLPFIREPACTTVRPENSVFVIFTSGSTGRPKGVVLTHAAIVTSAEAHGSKIGLGLGSRMLQFASYTFDNSLEEMFTTLQRGGCVCVPSEADRVNDIPGAIARLDANMMDLTPTVAALLEPADVPTIKRLCLGAEPLTKALVDLWSRHVHVFGQYGPSEASINSAFKDFTHGGEATNIGKAVGCVTWVVDPDNRNRLMPIGCKGELLLEGPILSRGYLNDIEKTQAAFIIDPQWALTEGTSQRRFYCTGDLVQYTSEGEMMYLGRKDSQVKLHGQRIELGEIEHHLRQNLPASAKSAVELVKFNDSNNTKALVAFMCFEEQTDESGVIVPAAILELSESARAAAKHLEVALANALPTYYVPAMFMPITSMPMTTSGKLDRKVLRALAAAIPESELTPYRLAGKSGSAPSGQAEIMLARLWASVLKLGPDAVGAEDSFFRLGGDSISAMRLVTASRKEGVMLNVANVFSQPKLSEMATTVVILSSEDMTAAAQPDLAPFELLPADIRESIIKYAALECNTKPDCIEDVFPCSKLQEGLVMLSNKDPGTYVVQPIYRLPSDVDISRFQKAWRDVVAEEAILRTRIVYTENHGFLQVALREELEWRRVSGLQDIDDATRRLPARNGAPLTTFTLVGENTNNPYFVWTAHHAVYDGWSWSALFRKVEAHYRGTIQELPAPVPYSRFIGYLTSLDQKESDNFWLSNLENLTAPQFPQLPSPDHKVEANGQLLHQIQITRNSNIEVTIPSMIRAAWGFMLATYSGSDDVLWGETNSGREASVIGIETMIGPTITTAPVRMRLNRQLTIHEYLKETQRQSSTSLPYQYAGLQHIRKLSSEAAVACDFQSFLGIEAGEDLADADSDLWKMESANTIGTDFFSYALIFNCKVATDSVHVEALYDNRVVEPWLLERLVQQFEYLLRRFNSPVTLDQKLADVSFLNSADTELIKTWNGEPVEIVHRCIHDVIKEDQTAMQPGAVAIDAWDTGVMTYKELDDRATALAHRLLSMGVKSQQFVPMCFDKSGWTIVAILAILKAGAAFVPLDFEAPILRLRELVDDIGADLLLCAPQLEQLCQSIPCNTHVVDRIATEPYLSSHQSLPEVDSESRAYVFYTSGSTGKPKGAEIRHYQWTTSSSAFSPGWDINRSSRVLQFASYTFDACLIEIFSTLMCGGTVCVPDQAARTNDLVGVINKFNVNWATLTPSVVRMMQPSQVPDLKTLVLVGEAMSQHDLATWSHKVRLGNGYGPTECAAISTSNIMTTETRPNNLGKAVTSRGWIVSRDDHNELAPVGAIGELLLEGGAVGAGYLNNPERTSQSFISDTRWSAGILNKIDSLPLRIYKTGDLVKYNGDGTMLYLGRKDSQTKVRGQRLELSEVEHHLMADELVQNALAAVPSKGPCAKRLVGIVSLRDVPVPKEGLSILQVIPNDTGAPNITVLRDRLCERLPAYMIPSLWIAIHQFPLTPGGKMDRRRAVQWLEQMDADLYRLIATAAEDSQSVNANDIELKLQNIFANVLNLPSEDIRLNQSFLHLGGDSIAAMQVSSQCRAQNLPISVQDIIRSKSISALAATIDVADDLIPAPEALEYNLPFDISPIQRVFFETVGSAYNHFNQTEVFGLSRNFSIEDIQGALTALVTIHPMLRGRFSQSDTGIWQQRIEKDTTKSFRLRHHRVGASNDATLRPIIDDSQTTLNISDSPTFSVDLFDVDGTFSQAISLVAHHLIIDIVSWGVLLEDFQNLLNGVKPPSQSLPYHTWLQQQTLQAKQESARQVFPLSDVIPADFDYWGMTGQSNVSGDAIEEDVQLGARDTMLLLGAQDVLGTEILDILVAALLESFHKVFADRSIVTIHNEGHGRETFTPRQDLSRTIGWFSTLTPISLPLASDDSTDIINTIRWVKESRERTPDKGRPYFAYRLLTEEGRNRFAQHWPAEVIFNYLGKMQGLDRKDSFFTALEGIESREIGDDVPRLSLFDITAAVSQGTVKFSFGWNRHMKHQTEIRNWIAQCRQTLVNAVDALLQVQPEPYLGTFKHLPLLYNGSTRLAAVLPENMSITDVEDVYPVSPMQQGLLITQSRNPDLYIYDAIFEVRSSEFTQSIDPRRLAEAWQTVVHRHPALRTVFVDSLAKTGTKDQIVLKEKPGRIQFLDDCEDSEIAGLLRAQASIDCRESLPPHRVTICTTKTDKVWVKMELSHAINDGTSISNILNDLSSAYARKLTRADTGPLFSHYIGYILASSKDADLAYWKTYLSGVEPCFFPTLNDGKSNPHEPGSIDLHLGSTKDVQAFCKQNGVTLSNVLQLAWALTLHCFVGSSDVSFGLVASGRDIPVKNIDEAVGCFVNMLIARLSFSDETTIAQLLDNLQTGSMNALSHQTCPLAEIQHELQLPALFNTAFTFQRRSISRDPEETALLYENMEAADPGEYVVTVNTDVTDEDISVDFGYWKDKILPSQAQNMADTFSKILDGIIASGDGALTVGQMDFFTTGSLKQVMGWNSDLPSAIRRCVHEVIHEQALTRPRATKAVDGWDGTFTYQEFDRLTDQLAVYLQANGVTTETFVPILFDKSSWAIISMIAIMKAGGAYVPLDPKHPQTRLQELISDVGAKIVLCSRNHHAKASEVAAAAFIIDQRAFRKLAVPSGSKPKSLATPDNAAYCLFTSGTTGRPKGTVNLHGGFVTSAAAFTRRMNINATSRTFQFASYTFDASCIEILSALTVGATVCVPSESDRMNDPAGSIRKLKVNWSLLTPSVLGTIEPDRVPSLRTLVSGGEALPGPILKKWGTSTCFINAYGPTECAVVAATSYKSTLDHKLLETEPGTIGTGSGARLWVVHPRNHDKLMPVGSVGELVIEGPTVARGYLNDEIKTAKAFIENPAWAVALSAEDPAFQAVRMYKSGDLVRYNTDGSVSYIGRKDTQIKLNGQRIELGEIEFHVGKNLPDNVQSAVELVTPSNRNTAKALAVFFAIVHEQPSEDADTPQAQATESEDLLVTMNDELRDMCKTAENGLAGSLPSYMIPSIFIPVAKMPWTSAGKLDRNRLRNLVQVLDREVMGTYRLTSMANKKQPKSEFEKKIHKAVCSVLNLPASSVGIDDSFVRLGGDSISAMRLVASAQVEKLNLSFVDIFKSPKLADLAAIGSRSGSAQKHQAITEPFSLLQKPLTTTDVLAEIVKQCRLPINKIQDAYPTSPLQEALITLSIKQPGAYVAQHVLLLGKSVDIIKLKDAWQRAVQEIDILRTRIVQLHSGMFMQAILTEDAIEWYELSSLKAAEKEAGKLHLHIGDKLASYAIVNVGPNERYLVWTIHHALYDGWSIYLMLQRVQQLYQSNDPQLPQTPYTAFIQYLANTDAEASVKYWRDSLAGHSAYQFPQMPHSITEDVHSGQSIQHTVKLARHKHTDVTPSNVVRAAWALVLAAYTGTDDVIFGETLAGRDIAVDGITDVCGPVLTTVPTRVKLDRGATVLDTLHTISGNVTDRIPYQHHGLSEIKIIGKEMAAACDFQNLLVIQADQEGLPDSMWSVHDNGEQSSFFTYPLVLECKMGQENTEILAHYNTNVISTWQVERLLYQFESVLAQLNTVKHIGDVQVFSEQDTQLVHQWNDCQPKILNDTVPALIHKQVLLQPTKVAVSAHDGDLTYAELEDLASMLSQELVKHGAGPETLIPICLDKSRWAVVAIMGILISGAAYVPLSPDYPVSRHQQIIETCKSNIVVCSPVYESVFATLIPCIVPVSEATIRSLPVCSSAMISRAKSDSTCYVIFTSGSTGVPKGVVVEHRTIISSSAAICEGLHIGPDSRVFQFCSFLFDVSVGETLTALMCGATVCVPSDEQRTTNLAAAITSLNATWAFLTPSVANTLEGPKAVPTLKTLVAGGEAMTPEVIEKWAAGVHLYNGYGPTEGTVFAVANDQVSTQRDPSNIGRMLKSGRAWLTKPDDPHQLAPVGAVAELCLEGPLLARGYLNDPQKTAESFIEKPGFVKKFSNVDASRIYRTGDLVRYAQDGSIHYLGRKDDQIKLAGQRIEIGEIEHHLQADIDIRQVVVSLPQSGPCEKKLTAVLNVDSKSIDTSTDQDSWHILQTGIDILKRIDNIKDRLSDLVPSYMVPNIWIPVTSIPLLASTKFDKKKVRSWLEVMEHKTYQHILELENREIAEKPVNSAVVTLRIIWAKVLNMDVEDVKPNRSWLSLGGDSITAMKLLARCRNEGINLTLNQVLRAKSLSHLAEGVKSPVLSDHISEETNTPFDLSPIQRFYFNSPNVEAHTHFNQSQTMRLSKRIGSSEIKQAFDKIVECHSMLRARFNVTGDGQWQQHTSTSVSHGYAFSVHDVSSSSVVVSIISNTQKSLNIRAGPVFAVNLFNIASEGQILFIASHHLVVDVVSWGVILGDLEDLLTSRSAMTLPKSLPFQAWCDQQKSHALDPAQQQEMHRQSLRIHPADLAFWGMYKRPNVYGDVERDEFTLDPGTSAMALDNHGAMRTDVVDLLLAAIVHSFSRVFINRKTPTIFNESHGREAWASSNVDLSRTVGWFTSMYPVTVPIGEEEDETIHTMRQVKDARRKIIDNGRPYFAHRFLTDDGKQRYGDHAPMEVLFNYTGRQQQHDAKDTFFQPVHFTEDEEDETSDVGVKTTRMALFEISASVSDGQLQVSFMYNNRMKNRKGIRRWVAECERTLEEIVTDLAEIKIPQPTMADFPLLPLESYERLDRVLKTLPSAGVLSPDLVEDIYPCSSIQDGMILSQIKNPESYWSSTTFEVNSKKGPVDATRVAEAWHKVVQRHPALRTVFIDSVCKGGVFDQIVVKSCDTGIVRYKCNDAEVKNMTNSVRYSDLNGKKKPALPHQAAIIQTTSGKIVVKIIVNHAVIDGGSLGIIGRDLQEAYEGRLLETEGPLYSDYIKYLRSLSAGDAVNYWKEKLRGVRPCYFPTTSQRTSTPRQLRSLDMRFDRWADLHVLAETSNATFANILLAAWALVLRIYTDSQDVCYGYLTSGRNVPINDIESAVGAFINMLVSRLQVTPATSLLDVITKVQTDFIEAMPHQHCSLAQFQHDLGLSGKPLFNTAVSIQNRIAIDDTSDGDSGIEFEQLDGHDPSEFAITVNIDATRNDEAVRFTYWSDAVTDGEAKNVSTLMARILSQALENSKQTIAELGVVVKGGKSVSVNGAHLSPPKLRPSILRSRSSTSHTSSFSSTSPPRTPHITFPDLGPSPAISAAVPEQPDWSSLIRSIVSEMVPQIVEQIVAKNQIAPNPASATVDQMTSQMTGLLARRASQSQRGRPNMDTASMRAGSIRTSSAKPGSIRSRRMSTTSNAESRIQTAADMVAAVGVLATEAQNGVAPDYVEKKLLALWSELLEMVEETVEQDDSFFQLGGDSILAMRLVGAAREEGLSMTVADVFKNPTFADMSRVVRIAGEVIDEVMSRAGGESIAGRSTGGPSRPRLSKRASSLWDDFQSVISDYNVDTKSLAPSIQPEPEPTKNETVSKKMQGLATGLQQSRPQAQRRPSSRSQLPQTIQEGVETVPKSISLLGDPNVDSVISKVQVFKGGISDVFPVTDFQALAITGTLLESKWMLNYFYLDGNGPLDLRKLKQAAYRMVQAFDILRTVFVPYGDRFLQVVLRKLQPDFVFQQTDDDIETFTNDLRQRDRENGPRLGEAFIQFVVAKQKHSGNYRIFMRLSHAQYDGVCMSKILGALQDGYNGLPVSSAPSFGNFVRETAKTVAGAHDHWREILRGSKMTEIVNRFGPNYQRSAGRTVTLEERVTVPKLSRINITSATVVKAAWSATLARIAGKSDIVFGHVISGRNSGVANVENIVGPCLNMVPVRVVYRPEWTVQDLLTYIQDQQISNMPFESLGFREITRHCTDWPDWTNFSSVLQHDQNIQSDKPTMVLGGIEYSVGAVGSQEDFADFSIHSTSRGGNQMDVTLTYAPNSTITADFAQQVFEMLCANIVAFAQDPQALLPSPSELRSRSSTTINSDKVRSKSADKQPVALPSDTGLSKHEVGTLATTLRSAWEQILHDEHGAPTLIELGSDFFQLGGDIMGLAQVASILDQEEGFRVRVEDFIDKSIFVEQVGLLAIERKKQIDKERQDPWGEKGKSKIEEKAKMERKGSSFGNLVKKMGIKRKGSSKP
ncbi:nonribosomal peptide synthase-like protein [Plenodomus tracheiphilus IPT5]|uniref:Nonribosomal peptide synthase-like protein n=1 Tax=Plenodomus tracheiphilus IPT5 TaxID=1408161 RepID=A0A6A7AV86_9PLEO|nr:nonribosomal peptide synthase-like protein [Plenodomus tracheiphilus IPT5]